MKAFNLSIILCLFSLSIFAQQKDDPIVFDNAIIISPNYSFQLPMSDMYHSYGFNHNLGMELAYKFSKNWYIGVEGNMIFGPKVKDKNILNNVLTSRGFIIGADGLLEEVHMSERGMLMTAKIGKSFFFSPKNPNSGLLFKFGLGYMNHKIFIDVNEKNTPQLSKEIKKGYDRFSSGLVFTQYVGLIKLQRSNFLNLAFGIELTEGVTQNRRPFDFPSGKTLNKTRLDLLIAFKFNWILPIWNGQNSKSEYYYY